MKEVYLKLAELNTAAKANEIVREVDMQIVRDLENRIGDLNDWTRLLEFTLREHVSDLERSVESAHSLLESERTRWSAQEKQQQANFDQAVADARGKYQELQAEFDNFRMSAENTAANQNDMKQAEVDKLLAELSDDVCSRDAQISELKEENVCLTAARDELAVALAESKDKEQQLTEQMQKLNVSVDSLSNSLRDRCESQCSMLQGAKDELACTSAELAASREQVHQLTEEIAALNKTRCDQSKTDADVLMLQAAKEHVSELTAELACTKDLVRQLLECLQGALSDTSGKAEAGGSKPADEVLEMGALNRKLWIQDHQIRQLQHLLCPRACDHDGSFHAKMFAPRMCGVGLMIAKVCNRD
jgi:chromosome segregation ATPase